MLACFTIIRTESDDDSELSSARLLRFVIKIGSNVLVQYTGVLCIPA